MKQNRKVIVNHLVQVLVRAQGAQVMLLPIAVASHHPTTEQPHRCKHCRRMIARWVEGSLKAGDLTIVSPARIRCGFCLRFQTVRPG